LRLFLALWPDAVLRRRLLEASRTAVLGSGAKPIPEEDLHLTLAFLGEVADGQQAPIEAVSAEVASRHQPFELALSRIGCFERARALWIGGSAPPPLRELIRDLNRGLVGTGLEVDRRRFQPHVTVARDLKQAEDGQAETELGLGELDRALIWLVDSIGLVASRTGADGGPGGRYQVVREWSLTDAPSD
jgi:2'-5' RNA ligase